MNIYANMKVRVMAGQYAGARGEVVRVLPDFGECGFVEVKFERTNPALPVADLVPLGYIALVAASKANTGEAT